MIITANIAQEEIVRPRVQDTFFFALISFFLEKGKFNETQRKKKWRAQIVRFHDFKSVRKIKINSQIWLLHAENIVQLRQG